MKNQQETLVSASNAVDQTCESPLQSREESTHGTERKSTIRPTMTPIGAGVDPGEGR